MAFFLPAAPVSRQGRTAATAELLFWDPRTQILAFRRQAGGLDERLPRGQGSLLLPSGDAYLLFFQAADRDLLVPG